MTLVLDDVAGWILSIYLETIYQSTRRNWNMSPTAQQLSRSGMGKLIVFNHSFIHRAPSPIPTYSLPTLPLAASYTLDTAILPLARS
jgi:hypothetical protein